VHINTKRDFDTLDIKVLSQIKILVYGHVAHKIEQKIGFFAILAGIFG